MRGIVSRKSAPGVKGGKVQKKNRQTLSPDIYEHEFDELVVIRERPLKGYFHAVTPSDVRRWVRRIPEWAAVTDQVKAVVLTEGGDWAFGRYNNAGIIKIDAWPKRPEPLAERKDWLVERIWEASGSPWRSYDQPVALSRSEAKAFLLLGTFLHELGHHLDRITTRSGLDAANGEPFAIDYELRRQRELWDAYLEEFGAPKPLSSSRPTP